MINVGVLALNTVGTTVGTPHTTPGDAKTFPWEDMMRKYSRFDSLATMLCDQQDATRRIGEMMRKCVRFGTDSAIDA